MAELDATIQQVSARIKRYLGQSIGETDTKNVLIDPILRALGWDIEDLEEVKREYKPRRADNPVDYALSLLRTPRLFVEAKSLGQNLSDRKWASQIVSYASVAGVEWVALTNGDEWRIYNAHAPVPVEEKLFRIVHVSAGDGSAAETLLLLSKDQLQDNLIEAMWKAHFVDRQVRDALLSLFGSEPNPGLVRLVSKRATALSASEIRASLVRVHLELDFPGPVPPLRSLTVADKTGSVEKPTPSIPSTSPPGTPWRHITVKDLIDGGHIAPPVELDVTYKGHHLRAQLEPSGKVRWDGTAYDSLSIAGAMARKSVIGAPPGRQYPQTNGWTFWHVTGPDGRRRTLDAVRREAFEGKAR